MNKKAIQTCAVNRKAVKLFDPNKKISKDDFDFLLEIARFSPSSFGLEPWSILVIQNKTLREELCPLASGAQNQLRTASHFIIFTVKNDLLPSSRYFLHINKDIKKMDDKSCDDFLDSFSLFQTQKLQVFDERTRLDWAKKQAYIAMGNMLLAAIEIGIDSCPIEGFFTEKVETLLEEKGIINTQNDRIAVMVAFGYRDDTVPIHKKTRRELDEIIKIIE